MIGLPTLQTRVEKFLTFTGYVFFGLGLALVISSIIVFVAQSLGVSFFMPTALGLGAKGVVTGLLIVGVAQALGSLRVIAENQTSSRGSL